MIKREIIGNNSGERTRLACRRRRLAVVNFQTVSTLFDVDRPISDRSDKSGASFLLMKYLAGAERHRQIELQRRNFRQSHRRTLALRQNSVT